MEIARISVSGIRADVLDQLPVTSGTVGATVSVIFDTSWSGMQKTYVWRCGDVTKDDLTASGIVPAEVLQKPWQHLFFGVYGTMENKATPTVWADLGVVLPGADPSGDESADPQLPVWAQLQQKVAAAPLIETAEIGQTIVVEEVDENGKPIKWKAVDMGGAAEQADYEAAKGEPGHILNRPFYTETVFTDFIAETEITITGGVVYHNIYELFEYPHNQIGVMWDGVRYVCDISIDDGYGRYYIGDQNLVKYPFYFYASYGNGRIYGINGSHTFALLSVEKIIHQIPEQYETDPTVPEWAKQPQKPTYTADEVGAQPAGDYALKSEIPQIPEFPTIPTQLPNPHKLTFTGAVSAEYDGSEAVSVEIPRGGGNGGAGLWEHICDITTTEETAKIEVTENTDGVPLSELKYNEIWVLAKMVGVSANTGSWWKNIGTTDTGRTANGAMAGGTTSTRNTSCYLFIRGNKAYWTDATGIDPYCAKGGDDKWISHFLDYYNSDHFVAVTIQGTAVDKDNIGVDTEIRILGRRA